MGKKNSIDDIGAELRKSIVESFLELSKEGVLRSQILRAVREYITAIDALPKEKTPLVGLVETVLSANDFTYYIKKLAMKKHTFRIGQMTLPKKVIAKTMRQFEKPYKKTIDPLMSREYVANRLATRKYEGLTYSGAEMKFLLLPHAFMMTWTAIESYLELRVKNRVFSNEQALLRFAKELRDDDFPTKWRGTDERVKKIDFATNLREIVDEYLTFPYHDFSCKSHMSIVYRQCFDVILTKYPRIKELQHFAILRHDIVHKGLSDQGTFRIFMKYADVRKLNELALDFAEWLELQIEEADRQHVNR